MWKKLKAVLGALTDLLLIGRNRGWWKRREGPFEEKRRGGR